MSQVTPIARMGVDFHASEYGNWNMPLDVRGPDGRIVGYSVQRTNRDASINKSVVLYDKSGNQQSVLVYDDPRNQSIAVTNIKTHDQWRLFEDGQHHLHITKNGVAVNVTDYIEKGQTGDHVILTVGHNEITVLGKANKSSFTPTHRFFGNGSEERGFVAHVIKVLPNGSVRLGLGGKAFPTSP